MANNITTLLQKDDADNLQGDDLLYLVQGTASNRDRKLKLEALQAYMMSGGSNNHRLDLNVKYGHFADHGLFITGYQGGTLHATNGAIDLSNAGASNTATINVNKVYLNETISGRIDKTTLTANSLKLEQSATGSGHTETVVDCGKINIKRSLDESTLTSSGLTTGEITANTIRCKTIHGTTPTGPSTSKLVVDNHLNIQQKCVVEDEIIGYTKAHFGTESKVLINQYYTQDINDTTHYILKDFPEGCVTIFTKNNSDLTCCSQLIIKNSIFLVSEKSDMGHWITVPYNVSGIGRTTFQNLTALNLTTNSLEVAVRFKSGSVTSNSPTEAELKPLVIVDANATLPDLQVTDNGTIVNVLNAGSSGISVSGSNMAVSGNHGIEKGKQRSFIWYNSKWYPADA